MSARQGTGQDSITDARACLIDSLFRRIIYFAQYLGFTPTALLTRFSAMVAALPKKALPREALRDGRSFAAAHAGPEIMRVWHQELDFLDAQGKPRLLPLKGETPNFTSLVKRATPGVETATALADLLASRAVQIDKQGLLVPLTSPVTIGGIGRCAEVGLYAADNLLSALENNLHSERPNLLLQREAVCARFARAEIPRARRFLNEQNYVHLEQVDEWMHRFEPPADAPADEVVTIILGSYMGVRPSVPLGPVPPARKTARKRRR
jgi:hypothetical protein